ncbi:MAG: reverse transcriptase domain-containing protein, partial [Glaciimonas sp.]|nr:reverse transcriptase domain-containing protein [Glaciimonas sp.]
MTPKIHVALALADTLLACEATQITFVNSAQWALGKKWRWIPAVCRAILTQTQDLPHQHSRTVLANIILKHTGYNAAWEGNSPAPQIQHYCLNPALLSTAPAWVVALALPQLNNTNELAQWLEISPEKLTWYADQWRDNFHSDTALQHYHYRWLEKKNGGWRLLEIPKIHLRALQKTILHKLLYLVPPHQAAHGFRRAHSCVTHAVLHTKQRIVIRMDLKDFFSSISAAKVHAVFKTIGYPSKVASLLARICSHRTPNQELTEHMRIRHRLSWQERQILRTRHLPQGSP